MKVEEGVKIIHDYAITQKIRILILLLSWFQNFWKKKKKKNQNTALGRGLEASLPEFFSQIMISNKALNGFLTRVRRKKDQKISKKPSFDQRVFLFIYLFISLFFLKKKKKKKKKKKQLLEIVS